MASGEPRDAQWRRRLGWRAALLLLVLAATTAGADDQTCRENYRDFTYAQRDGAPGETIRNLAIGVLITCEHGVNDSAVDDANYWISRYGQAGNEKDPGTPKPTAKAR